MSRFVRSPNPIGTLRLNAMITARTSEVPAQAGQIRYEVASQDAAASVVLQGVFPDDRVVRPVDADDNTQYPDIIPATLGSICELVRQQGVWVLRGTNEGVKYGPCPAPEE